MGHLSSYIHIETIARHHRMKGEGCIFSFGFDDNGLPTERYVEKNTIFVAEIWIDKIYRFVSIYHY